MVKFLGLLLQYGNAICNKLAEEGIERKKNISIQKKTRKKKPGRIKRKYKMKEINSNASRITINVNR